MEFYKNQTGDIEKRIFLTFRFSSYHVKTEYNASVAINLTNVHELIRDISPNAEKPVRFNCPSNIDGDIYAERKDINAPQENEGREGQNSNVNTNTSANKNELVTSCYQLKLHISTSLVIALSKHLMSNLRNQLDNEFGDDISLTDLALSNYDAEESLYCEVINYCLCDLNLIY